MSFFQQYALFFTKRIKTTCACGRNIRFCQTVYKICTFGCRTVAFTKSKRNAKIRILNPLKLNPTYFDKNQHTIQRQGLRKMFTALLQLLQKLFFPTGYFANGSYPQPLSPEQESKCLQEMQQGSKKAREKLITHNMRLVAHIAKKYAKDDMEDMISIGSIGLIKGVETFSPQKGANLATYLARCIENEILMNIRSNKRYQNTVYLDSPLGVDNDGNEYTLMDILVVKEDSVFKQAELSILRTSLLRLVKTRLNEREQKVILMRYGILPDTVPLTQLQTAKKLRISRSYVSRIETRALEKLKEALEEVN